jgi:hypothetical protein
LERHSIFQVDSESSVHAAPQVSAEEGYVELRDLCEKLAKMVDILAGSAIWPCVAPGISTQSLDHKLVLRATV